MIYPFKSIENYPQMLNTIAGYVFVYMLISMSILSFKIPAFKSKLDIIPLDITINDNSFNILIVIIALLFAIFSRVTKLHDKISDLFFIRYFFDLNHILIPLAKKSSIDISGEYRSKLYTSREKLMKQVFYKYASSTKDKCLIDHHNVIMALTQFTGLWILIELAFISLVISIVLLIAGYTEYGTVWLFIVLIAVVLSHPVYLSCRKYTKYEIHEISSNEDWMNDIKENLNGL